MAFRRRALYTFKDENETGINNIPINSTIFVASTKEIYILNDIAGMDDTTTIGDAISSSNMELAKTYGIQWFSSSNDFNTSTTLFEVPYENNELKIQFNIAANAVNDGKIINFSIEDSVIVPAGLNDISHNIMTYVTVAAGDKDDGTIFNYPVYIDHDSTTPDVIKVRLKEANISNGYAIASANYMVNESSTNKTYSELNWYIDPTFEAPGPITDFTASDTLGERIRVSWTHSDTGLPQCFYNLIDANTGAVLKEGVKPGFELPYLGSIDLQIEAINSEGKILSNIDNGNSMPFTVIEMPQFDQKTCIEDWLINEGYAPGAYKIINNLIQPTICSGDLSNYDIYLLNNGEIIGQGTNGLELTDRLVLENLGWIRTLGAPAGSITFDVAGAQSWTVPDYLSQMEVCMIGGGGSGGISSDVYSETYSGGGAAGEIITDTLFVAPGESIDFYIGAGGASPDGSGGAINSGNPGEETTILGLTAAGGVGGTNRETEANTVYKGDEAETTNCFGTFTDGNLAADGSRLSYGGQAGFADGTDGVRNGATLDAQYGAGSGGLVKGDNDLTTGKGGDGVIHLSWPETDAQYSIYGIEWLCLEASTLGNLDGPTFDTGATTPECSSVDGIVWKFCMEIESTSIPVVEADGNINVISAGSYYLATSTDDITNVKFSDDAANTDVTRVYVKKMDTITSIESMFFPSWTNTMDNLTTIEFGYVNFENVTNMEYAFMATGIQNLSINHLDTSNVTSIRSFLYKSKIEKLSLRGMNFENVDDMFNAFSESRLKTIDFRNIKFPNSCDMSKFFKGCYYLECITNLDTTGSNTDSMFDNCYALVHPDSDEQEWLKNGNVWINDAVCEQVWYDNSDNYITIDDLGSGNYQITGKFKGVDIIDVTYDYIDSYWTGSIFRGNDEYMYIIGEPSENFGAPPPSIGTFKIARYSSRPYHNFEAYIYSSTEPYFKMRYRENQAFPDPIKQDMGDGRWYLYADNCYGFYIDSDEESNNSNIKSIKLLATNDMTDLESAFDNSTGSGTMLDNLINITFEKTVDTRRVTTMGSLVRDCRNIVKFDASNLHFENVIDLSHMLDGCNNINDIKWSTTPTWKTTDMSYMLSQIFSLEIMDISVLNIANVTDMSRMFKNSGFKFIKMPADISNGPACNMNELFYGCSELECIDVINTENATGTSYMFVNCDLLVAPGSADQDDIENQINQPWVNPSECVPLFELFIFSTDEVDSDMFETDANLALTEVTGYPDYKYRVADRKNDVAPLEFKFADAPGVSEITKVVVKRTGTLTNMDYFFSPSENGRHMDSLTEIIFEDTVNTSNVTSMRGLFKILPAMDNSTIVGLSNVDTRNVEDMHAWFERNDNSNFTQINLETISTQSVTDLSDFFLNCNNLEYITMPSDIITVQPNADMYHLFYNCEHLKCIDKIDTTNATDTTGMFYDCVDLTAPDSAAQSDIENQINQPWINPNSCP